MTNFYCKLILFVAVFILIVNHGNTQCPPDLVGLSNQAQVDQFVQDWPNCTHLNASLHLNSAELNDISKLSNIVSINGQLSVSNTNLQELSLPNLEYMLWGVTAWRNTSLRKINLPALDGAIGGFNISECDLIDTIIMPQIDTFNYDGIAIGDIASDPYINFESLFQVDSAIVIYRSGITNLDFLQQIKNYEGYLVVTNNSQLENCNAICPLFYQSIQNNGYIEIEGNLGGCETQQDLLGTCLLSSISGKLQYSEQMGNCDAQSFGIPNTKVFLNGDETRSTITNQNGEYIFFVDYGNYDISVELNSPAFYEYSPLNIPVNIVDDSAVEIDFCAAPTNSCSDLSIQLFPIGDARPGFEAEYNIRFSNNGNQIESGSIFLDYDSNHLSFVGSSPEASEINSNQIEWSYQDLQPFESRNIIFSFLLNPPTDPDYPLDQDDILKYSCTIFPAEDDKTRADNFDLINQTVVNSFDPNDKTALIGSYQLIDSIANELSYLIRFENIGTASAINIKVEDQINLDQLDINSLKLIDSSHPVLVSIDSATVTFDFFDINLGFEDFENDGYVVFKIKPNPNLELGDIIENEAAIFFDFNEAIITNVSSVLITKDDDQDGFIFEEDCDDLNPEAYPGAIEILGNGIDEDCDGKDNTTATDEHLQAGVKIYPVPADDFIEINCEINTPMRIEIFNTSGQLKIRSTMQTATAKFDISSLKSGVYLLNLTGSGEKQRVTRKLVISSTN